MNYIVTGILGEVLLWQRLKRKQIRGYDFDRQRPIDNPRISL
jgi:very-short-patch-repair endonuclease